MSARDKLFGDVFQHGIMPALLSVSDALQQLLSAFQPVEPEQVGLPQAVWRVLAEEIYAGFDLPHFDSSTMDGFALNAQDIATANRDQPIILAVVGDVPAGRPYTKLINPGQSVRIMTGAPIPEGADAVIPIEDTNFGDQKAGSALPKQVQIFRAVYAGDYIRKKGKDARAQELILPRGLRLRPQEVGAIAMLGKPAVQVYRRPRLAILPTGDELLRVGDRLQPGKIYESNSYTISAQVRQAGGEAVTLGLITDTYEAVKDALDQALDEKVDLIVSSAGVSVGAYDFVRAAVEQNGKLSFWRVNMRPGKPVAFGSYRGTPFIGLPGNPVSSFVSFEIFVRPALLKLAGQTDLSRTTIQVELLEAVESDGRESYLRAVVTYRDNRAFARLTGHQDSGNLRSLIQANALLIIPNEVKCLPIGTEVQAWLI